MKKFSTYQNVRLALRYLRKRKEVNSFLNLTEERIEDYQFSEIKKLLSIAYYHTDFYKRKYDAVGMKPEDIRTIRDFEKVPTITKDELILYNREFIDKRIKDKDLICSKSSGSSGKFVNVYLSPETFIEEEIQVLRMLKKLNPNYGARDREVLVYTSQYPVTSILGAYKVYYINNLLPAVDIVNFIRKIKPKIVAIYPSILREIIEVAPFDLTSLGIETIITNSEHSTQSERDYFAKILNCAVYDEFSSEELQSIFCQCRQKKYHSVPDCTYIELLDINSDIPVKVGQVGEIVGTCLINSAMPIIRYRSGDLASESAAKCSCGSNAKVYENILGRKNASFKKSDGTFIPSGKILDWSYALVLDKNIDVREFQIIQESLSNVTIKIVVGARYDPLRDDPVFAQSFREYFGEEWDIRIELTDNISKTSAGKHIPIISKVF